MSKLKLGAFVVVSMLVTVVGTLVVPPTAALDVTALSETDDSQKTTALLDSIENELNYSAPVILSQADMPTAPVYEYLVGDEPLEVVSMEDRIAANDSQTVEYSTADGSRTDSDLSSLELSSIDASSEAQQIRTRLANAGSSNDDPVLEWHGYATHEDIAYEILTSRPMNDVVDPRYWQVLIDHAGDPDDSAVVNEEHFLINPIPYGAGADDKTEDCANDALAHFRLGELDAGYLDLSYSSHYLMDLGSPWHNNYPSITELDEHDEFEDWVRDNWDSEGLYLCCRNQDPSSEMAFTGYTLEQYAAELAYTVEDEYDIQWHYIDKRHAHDYYAFVQSVKFCLYRTAEFVSGLYSYVAPHTMLLDYTMDQYPYAEVHGVGHTEKVAAFVSSKIHIHLDLWNTATYGDLNTDYLYVYVYWTDGWSRTTFTELPETNGGLLEYDCVVTNSQYLLRKVKAVEIVWHQWTTGSWLLWDGEGYSTASTVSDGLGVTQTSSTYAEGVGSTFGNDGDPEHLLGVYPVTKVKVHLEMTIPETYGDIYTDWLYIDYYYTNGDSARVTFTNLPKANGGTVVYNCEFIVYTSTNYAIDYIRIEWHQWTYGQSTGNSWVMEDETTIYWDSATPASYPY